MWNKEGTNILVYLTQTIKELEQMRYDLSQQVLHDPPGVGRIGAFVHRLSKVRELLPVCGALRDKVSMARMDNLSVADILVAEQCALLEAAADYSGFGQTEAEHFAKLALTTFCTELSEFSADNAPAAAA